MNGWISLFETIEDAQKIATNWLWTYNNERPNMGSAVLLPPRN
jgi:putative transposase